MPFLTIITRHMLSRPNLLKVQQASLAAQTCQDFEQILIVDDLGRGFAWAQKQLADFVATNTDYIWVFDDDDKIACPKFIECLKAATEQSHPDVIMVKMLYAGQVLPGGWGRPPQEGQITQASYIVTADVWNRHRHAYTDRYQADYDFIADVWRDPITVVWHDCVAITDQRGRGLGRPE